MTLCNSDRQHQEQDSYLKEEEGGCLAGPKFQQYLTAIAPLKVKDATPALVLFEERLGTK